MNNTNEQIPSDPQPQMPNDWTIPSEDPAIFRQQLSNVLEKAGIRIDEIGNYVRISVPLNLQNLQLAPHRNRHNQVQHQRIVMGPYMMPPPLMVMYPAPPPPFLVMHPAPPSPFMVMHPAPPPPFMVMHPAPPPRLFIAGSPPPIGFRSQRPGRGRYQNQNL